MERSAPQTASSIGKLLTLLILLIAVLAAALAWWHNMNKGRAALAFWSGSVAHRIRTADSVELWVLATGDDLVARREDFGGRQFWMAQVIDISQAPGLVHARQALISDASFDWEATAGATGATGATGAGQADWQYAIRFTSDGQSTLVLLDLERAWAAQGDHPGRVARLLIADGLQEFLAEQVTLDGAC